MAVGVVEIAVAFSAAALVGILAQRLRMSVIPAYILAGMALGPFGFKVIADGNGLIREMSEFGLIFLLFFLGLEFSMDRLKRSGKETIQAGLIDLYVHFPLGFALGLAFGFTWLESLFLAAIVYVSSTGIAVKSLMDLQRIANRETEIVLGVMVFQDLVTALFIAVFGGVATATDFSVLPVLLSVGKAFAFAVVFLFAAKKLSRPLSRLLYLRNEELFILLIIGLVFAGAAVARVVGLSAAIGAFFFGVVVSETSQAKKVEKFVVPLRDLFAALFFFFFGMTVDVWEAPSMTWLLVIAIPLTVFSKILVGFIVGGKRGFPAKLKMNLGTALVPRGEFNIVLAGIVVAAASTNPHLPHGARIGAFAGLYVLVLALAGPFLMQYAARLVPPPGQPLWRHLLSFNKDHAPAKEGAAEVPMRAPNPTGHASAKLSPPVDEVATGVPVHHHGPKTPHPGLGPAAKGFVPTFRAPDPREGAWGRMRRP